MNLNKYEKFFKLDLLEGAKFTGKFEFPVIERVNYIPNELIPFDKALQETDFNKWVHFFIDDWKFSKLFNQPYRYLPILKKFNGVIAPDNSLFWNMPYYKQIESIGNSRMMGSWLQRAGINVIPTVRWGLKESYSFAFDGVRPGGTVAISSLGAIKNRESRKVFADGIPELVERVSPRTIIVYGSYDPSMYDVAFEQGVNVINFQAYTTMLKSRYSDGAA